MQAISFTCRQLQQANPNFNPKVAGSIRARPITNGSASALSDSNYPRQCQSSMFQTGLPLGFASNPRRSVLWISGTGRCHIGTIGT